MELTDDLATGLERIADGKATSGLVVIALVNRGLLEFVENDIRMTAGGQRHVDDLRVQQYDLYDGAPPAELSSQTSVDAAAEIAPHVNKLQRQVRDSIAASGIDGLTDDEGEEVTGLRHQTYSARRRELWQLSQIGTESSRKNESGRMANVWKLARYCKQAGATTARRTLKTCPCCGEQYEE